MMTRAQFARGMATFAILIVAGIAVGLYLDYRFTASEAEPQMAANEKTQSEKTQSEPAACIGVDGRWKHWHWANAPALSPKCRRAS